jgi:hypothetical protein
MTWTICAGPTQVRALSDGERYEYILGRGDDRRSVWVELAGTAVAARETLSSPIDDYVDRKGLPLVQANLRRVDPPLRIVIHSEGWRVYARDGVYACRDWVEVRVGGAWRTGEVMGLGEPDDALDVADPRVEGGTRRADIVWVRLPCDDSVGKYLYTDVRAKRLER